MHELSKYGSCTLEDDGCSTCGDTLVPVRVIEVEGNQALCEDAEGKRAGIATDFIAEVRPGMVLLVHMGVALACAETSEARHEIR